MASEPQQPFEPQQGASYSADQPTANEELLSSAIYHGLSLERVSAGMAADIKDVLTKAQEEIVGKLQSGTLTDWQTKKAQQFLEWSSKTLANAYNKIDQNVAEALDGIKEAEIHKQTNSVNQAVGVEISPAMSTQQLESIAKADTLLVNGAVMSDWWKKQAANLQHQVLTTVQQGLVQGKSTQDIAKDLRDFLPTNEDISQKQAVAQANALARTAAATVQSEAQQAYYKENDDIIKGIQWVSTLDSRTTPQCQALDGTTYQYNDKDELVPVGHDQPWPGFPPIHWNCRSTTVPVLKSWQELSQKELPHLDDQTVQEAFQQKLADQGFTPDQIADIQMNQRASVDGTVPAATTYEDWLSEQPELTQKSILGPAKWQLWHDGLVTLKDMINKSTLEPLTVDELIAAAKQNKAIPPPPPPVEGKYGLSLAEHQILTAQMTAGATSGEQWASWYNPENGVRVDQVLKSSVNAAEDAQLKAQNNLIHLTNSLSNVKFWNKSDASLWANQPGFQSAKLVTPSGRLITAKLKPGMTWTTADVDKYWAKLSELRSRGMDEFDAQEAAFKATKKMTVTQTEPGALQLDSSTMKKVYGPVHAEDMPLTFLEAHANQQQLMKDAELKSQMADIKAQMKAADEAHQAYAEESQKAREKQAQLQTMIAERDLAAAAQAKKEADDLVELHEKQVQDAKEQMDAVAADQAAAQVAAQKAQDELAALQQEAKEAKELEDKIAAEKAAEAAAKAAKEAADLQASLDARWNTVATQYNKAMAELDEHQANQQKAAELQAQHDAEVAAKKAQQKAIKSAAAKKGAATKAAKKAAAAQAAVVDTHGQMQLPLAPKAAIKTNFPADPLALPVVKELGGYTHAQLVKDDDGNLWVRKRGASADHIASEVLFDHLYDIAGVDVPESKLYSTPSGPVKLSVFVPDTTILGDYLKQATPSEKTRILNVVKDQFVANALFANWDAVGANPAAGFDNILVGKNGKAYMIDAGGAGEYKGTGVKAAGKFGPQVGELQTMLDPRVNPTTAPIFKGITDQQVVDQAVRIFQVRNDLLAATPAPLKAKLAARLDYLDNYVTDLVAQGKAQMPAVVPPVTAPAPPVAPPKVQYTPKGFPADPMALKGIEVYPVGNGIGEVVEDAAGNKYVRRTGGDPDAMLEESRAAEFLGKFGILTPEHEMFTDASGKPVMLQKFVEGDTVDKFLQTATDADKKKLAEALGQHFAIDALMGNSHVADGIRITRDKTGKMQVWRVDNSGAFRFNFTGGTKQAGAWENGQGVAELWTMRGLPAPHAEIQPSGNTVALLQHLDIVDVSKMLRDLPPVPPTTGDAQLDQVLLKRWQNMRQIAEGALDADHLRFDTDWLEGQTAQRGNLKQIGLTDRISGVELKSGATSFNLVDQNGKPWDDLRGGTSARPTPPAANTIPGDPFQTILSGVKTVNHKVGNPSAGPPNASKLDAAIKTKPMLEKWLKSGTPDQQAAAKKYLPFIQELEDVKATGVPKTITNFDQYVIPAQRPVATLPTGSIPSQIRAEIEKQMGPKAYNLIANWASAQSGDSQADEAKAMRGLWNEIRQVPIKNRYMGSTPQNIQAHVANYLNQVGLTKTEALKTMQIWNGFMQEFLNNMVLPNSDQDMRVIKLIRKEPPQVKAITPSGVQALNTLPAGEYQLIKGAFDSHSFVGWAHVKGQTYTTTAMPYSLVNAFYGMERSAYKTDGFFLGDSENEFAADGAMVPSKVIGSALPAPSNDSSTWGLTLNHLRPDDGSLD